MTVAACQLGVLPSFSMPSASAKPFRPGCMLPRLPQVLLEACPNPRRGVYGAQLAKLATAAQRPPGLLLQARNPCCPRLA
jgi:hypothetical protein